MNWIPKNGEIVKYMGEAHIVIAINFGGKVTLKKVTTSKMKGKKIEVDLFQIGQI